MSDQINHECGLALIRLLKPLDFYKKKNTGRLPTALTNSI